MYKLISYTLIGSFITLALLLSITMLGGVFFDYTPTDYFKPIGWIAIILGAILGIYCSLNTSTDKENKS